MSTAVSDRIEKQVLLRAPLSRVWRALTNHTEFGQWFGVRFDAPFRAGSAVSGVITPTTVDEEIAKEQKPYAGLRFTIVVDRIEPEKAFSFRWNPHGVDETADFSTEIKTLVEFTLQETAEGVLLKVVESGFDRIPLERRAKAFTANEGGWTMQMTLIRKYVEKTS
jgi:uncharacterized protein YndB with AHSA1/START domain